MAPPWDCTILRFSLLTGHEVFGKRHFADYGPQIEEFLAQANPLYPLLQNFNGLDVITAAAEYSDVCSVRHATGMSGLDYGDERGLQLLAEQQ